MKGTTLTRSVARAVNPASVQSKAAPSRDGSKDLDSKGLDAKDLDSKRLVATILQILDDAKAEETVTIDLTGKTTLADAMVVTTGRSNRHVSAIADQVIEELKKQGYRDLRVEGQPHCDWVLIDAGDAILHVFRPEVRSFYNLEKMWGADRPAERTGA